MSQVSINQNQSSPLTWAPVSAALGALGGGAIGYLKDVPDEVCISEAGKLSSSLPDVTSTVKPLTAEQLKKALMELPEFKDADKKLMNELLDVYKKHDKITPKNLDELKQMVDTKLKTKQATFDLLKKVKLTNSNTPFTAFLPQGFEPQLANAVETGAVSDDLISFLKEPQKGYNLLLNEFFPKANRDIARTNATNGDQVANAALELLDKKPKSWLEVQEILLDKNNHAVLTEFAKSQGINDVGELKKAIKGFTITADDLSKLDKDGFCRFFGAFNNPESFKYAIKNDEHLQAMLSQAENVINSSMTKQADTIATRAADIANESIDGAKKSLSNYADDAKNALKDSDALKGLLKWKSAGKWALIGAGIVGGVATVAAMFNSKDKQV